MQDNRPPDVDIPTPHALLIPMICASVKRPLHIRFHLERINELYFKVWVVSEEGPSGVFKSVLIILFMFVELWH